MTKYPIIILGLKPFLPHSTQTITIGKKTSINSIKFATQFNDNKVIVSFIKPEFDITKITEFTQENIYEVGLMCMIENNQGTDVSNINIVGTQRLIIKGLQLDKDLERYTCEYEEFKDQELHSIVQEQIISTLQKSIEPLKQLSGDYYITIKSILTNEYLSFTQKIFQICNKLLNNASVMFDKPISEIIDFLVDNISQIVSSIQFKISLEEKTKEKINNKQYKFWAQEQMSILQNELNENGDAIKNKILDAKLPKHVEEIALEEYEKLSEMPSYSSEAAVIKNYIKWIVSLPWNKSTENKNSLSDAKRILDESHWGMELTKERVLDFISLEHRNKNASPTTLLLHGLPGTGKTSIAQSIAKALNREFVRISLAGLSDSNKLRGQSRTYVGSSPGDIIRKLKIAQTNNPVIQLDEVDKVNTSDKNPMNVLHEILDPDFRKSFEDNYMDIPFSLDKALFILTANDISVIPTTIRDRCRIIAVESYNTEEKFQICKNFIIPKKFKEHNIKETEMKFTDESIKELIYNYTKEAGVRQLSERVENLISKALLKIETQSSEITNTNAETNLLPKTESFKIDTSSSALAVPTVVIDKEFITQSLPYSTPRDIPMENYVGIIRGLYYSPEGGGLTSIEVSSYVSESENIVVCGHFGQSMQESFKNALGYVKRNAKSLGIDSSFFQKRTFHINTWGAGTPKDGPSAGCAITTAIVSHCLNLPIPNHIAVTGEISLSGHSLLVGGIKEKCDGAHRLISSYTDQRPIVFLPHRIPEYMTKHVIGVDIIRVVHIIEIWKNIWPDANFIKNFETK